MKLTTKNNVHGKNKKQIVISMEDKLDSNINKNYLKLYKYLLTVLVSLYKLILIFNCF